MKDATINDQSYRELSEALGDRVPKSDYWHVDKDRPWSEYKAVVHELRKMARPDRTLLDIGCADGVYAIPWRRLGGGPALGLDIAPGFIKRASQAAQQQGVDGLRIVVGDIQDPSLDLGKFDVALMSFVLAHLNHPEPAIRNVRRHLKEGGVFLLQTPTPSCEMMLPLGLRMRYIRGMLSGQLKDNRVVISDEARYLQQHGVLGYRYHSDAYWPSVLPRWVEGFGFRRRRFYTVVWQLDWFPNWLWPVLRTFPVLNYLEMLARHVPAVNMFGAFNMGVFEAVR